MDPLVSIIIPAFNAAKTLEAAVSSVFQQSVQDFELIIVDDGSEDETVNIAASIGDTRIKIIAQTNAGASAARNTGIRAATGKYIAFLDADDLWLPQKLEAQLTALNSGTGGNAGWCGVYYVDDDLNILNVRPCFHSKDIFLDILRFHNQSQWMSTLIVERRALDKVGFFDTELAMIEDWEFMLRLSRHCDLKNIETPLTLYRQYPGNRSKDWEKHIEPGLVILEKVFSDPTLQSHIKHNRASIYAAFYLMLTGAAFTARNHTAVLKWGTKALMTHPGALRYMAQMPFRKLTRRSSRSTLTPEHQAMIYKMKANRR